MRDLAAQEFLVALERHDNLLLVLAAVLLASCNRGERPKTLDITLVTKALDSEWWQRVKKGANEAARANPDVRLAVLAPEREVNIDQQVSILEDQITNQRGVYCKLFDSACIQSEIQLDNSTVHACSYRELLTKSKKVRRLTKHDDLPVTALNAGGGKLIYEQGCYLHLLDLASGKSKRLKIGVAADLGEARPRFVKGAKYIRNATLSPSGARAALEVRGEIVTVPAAKGDPRILTNTSTAEMIKYTSNAVLATLISFSNELARLCSPMPRIVAYGSHVDTDGLRKAREAAIAPPPALST